MTGEEALCGAARRGDLDKVKSLIVSGADVTYFDSNGLNPLMHAAKHNHAEVVRNLLEAGAPWNALSPSNQSAGDYAMEAGHQEVFDVLLNAALQAEMILGTILRKGSEIKDSDNYLEDRVSFSEDKIMDAENKAVMMAWEKPLMEAHAKAVCSNGGHILNIGFGMGLVDTAIRQYAPASHTIIEAHPEVYDRMIQQGWDKKENVKIIFGRWQDVISKIQCYDGIFFDTYGEYYEDMRAFHQYLPKLLKPGGIYSFFNGLCGANPFFHSVYCQLVSLELASMGFSTQFIQLPVKDCFSEQIWEGVKHKYWQLDTYYLPVCHSPDESD
ncbi:unnamed protein product [Cuscuta campestris]|uniref:Protein arginine N-methyltransferase 2 n=1 Tax=Cuscuta campestris TaxID=132261 RepID=A0A484MPS5_9ASTE|nr:unnamed protein product [Cuscuta campestris]